MAMLVKQLLNLSPKPTSFNSSCLSEVITRLLSSKSSSNVSSGVAGVIEEHDLVYPIPRVEMANMPVVIQLRVVVYDGVCHLSHRGVKWVIKVDKEEKIKFCCLQSKAAEPYLRMCGVERKDVGRRFLFVEGHGLYHQGSTAAIRVLSYLPLPYSALTALAVVPPPLRDAAYDYIARRRYHWFGKSNDCLVLRDQHLLYRFVDRDEIIEKSRSTL